MTRYMEYDLENAQMVRVVRDFKAGIFYRIYEEYSNCSVHLLTDDFDDFGDIVVDADGNILMPSWFQLFGYDMRLTVNSKNNIDNRGFEIEISQNVTGDRSYLLGVSFGEIVDSEGDAIKYWPAFVEHYLTDVIDIDDQFINRYTKKQYFHLFQKYNEKVAVMRQNIFNFDLQPRFGLNVYDIRDCFRDDLRIDHREIRFSLENDLIGGLKDPYLQQSAVQGILAFIGNVELVRVQQVELFYNAVEKVVYVVFSIVDFPREKLKPDLVEKLDDDVKIPLYEVLENIEKVVKAGEWKQPFISFLDEIVEGTADENYFKEVNRAATDHSHNKITYKNSFKGFSGGAMAGLAFGMILLGSLIGSAVYYFALRNGKSVPDISFSMKSSRRSKSEIPKMSFTNPLA